jgi:ribonuclease BN (tRNA processing enzyme)
MTTELVLLRYGGRAPPCRRTDGDLHGTRRRRTRLRHRLRPRGTVRFHRSGTGLLPSGGAVPALAYRFDTPDGSVAFSGGTTVNEDLITLARGADILIHQVADLNYLKRHGTDDAKLARMPALHTDVTQVGDVAERARVREPILSHYLPADPAVITEAEWAQRAGYGFSGTTTAGWDGPRRTLHGEPVRFS